MGKGLYRPARGERAGDFGAARDHGVATLNEKFPEFPSAEEVFAGQPLASDNLREALRAYNEARTHFRLVDEGTASDIARVDAAIHELRSAAVVAINGYWEQIGALNRERLHYERQRRYYFAETMDALFVVERYFRQWREQLLIGKWHFTPAVKRLEGQLDQAVACVLEDPAS